MPLPYAIELGIHGARRHPRTMLLTVLTLALGLAAVMTMLTLLQVLSADPLPGISQQLYLGLVDSRQLSNNTFTEPDALPPSQWKLADVQAFMASHHDITQTALASSNFNIASEDQHESAFVRGVVALGPMPRMFGVPLREGRYWTEQEERDRVPVAIIGHQQSLRLFGTEHGLGHQLRLGKHLFRVIGISGDWGPQPAFYFTQSREQAWDSTPTELLVPVQAALDADAQPLVAKQCDDGPGSMRVNIDLGACRWLMLWAQLQTKRQEDDYRNALLAFAQARHAAGVFPRPPQAMLYDVPTWLDSNNVVPDTVQLNLWLAMALLGLCILNVAGLLAARFLRRASEIGVHRVLGAPRRAIFARCLVESGLIGLLGGVLALPLTLFGLWVVRLQDANYSHLAQFRTGLFGLLVLLAICTGLLVGLIPAWRASRLSPAMQVKSL
ncbi:ABC transporter permease [Xanthomonas sp. MUS 060]|uniref:ABC transporter permease n=1 Tax=Xanthomonas sp. MUS 060 TaxID=1588031 RepID=UPI0005F2B26D|nr:ABC transporter permease [Xanthomonas sp. MUS 060]